MANKFLIDLDLNGNEIQNFGIQTTGTLPSSPFNGQVVNHSGTIKVYDQATTSWKVVGLTADGTTITDSSGTISVGTIAISNVSNLQSSLDGKVDDSQVLTNVPSGAVFTDTTYTAGDGLGLSGTEFAVDGTVVRTSGDQSIGGVKTFTSDVTVEGDLTVSGSVITTLSEQVEIEDNKLLLNSNVTGTPSEDSGLEVERGTSANVQLIWDESADRWTFTNDGTNYHNLPVTGEYSSTNGTVTNVTGGTGISVSSGTTTPQVSLSHLGLEGLVDPNDDRIFFWDDSAGAAKWLDLGTNLAISGTTINATDTNTTYSLGSSDGTNTAAITLTPSAGGSQSVTLAGGSNVTINESAGTITISADSGSNFYAEALSFDTSTGALDITMNGTTDLSVSLDGRYLTSESNGFNEVIVAGQGSFTAANAADSFTLTAGTNTSIGISGDNITISSTDTQLTTEEVEDIVGAMVTGNTEAGVAVSYQDGDGTLDFQTTWSLVEVELTGHTAGTYKLTGGTAQQDFGAILPQISVYELDGSNYVEVSTSVVYNGTSGDMDIYLPSGDFKIVSYGQRA